MEERAIVFWSCDDNDETLSYTDMDEAVEAYLDEHHVEGPLKVYGYSRMEVRYNGGSYGPLEKLLEDLDEEYGSPDDEADDPTEKMREAEAAFIEAVLAEYVPWACETTKTVEIDPVQWIKEHRPDWLEEGA